MLQPTLQQVVAHLRFEGPVLAPDPLHEHRGVFLLLVAVVRQDRAQHGVLAGVHALVVPIHQQRGAERSGEIDQHDDGDDETSDYTTFTLHFMESGVLHGTDLLSSNSNPYEGTWSITDSNSNDDNLNDLDFNMNFNVGNKLDDLSDDWDIISYSDTEIKLIDVSGGNGGTDYLTLTKQ